jgi:hypothetical protein
MKKLWPLLSSLFILAAPFITLSCGSVTSPEPGLNIVTSISRQPAGSMTFRIGVENTGTKTENLQFGSSQFFDIEVENGSGHLVWQYSFDSYFLALVWGFELAPGQSSQVQEYVWNLTGNDKKPMPSGSYKAKIYITNNPRDEGLSSEIRLTI